MQKKQRRVHTQGQYAETLLPSFALQALELSVLGGGWQLQSSTSLNGRFRAVGWHALASWPNHGIASRHCAFAQNKSSFNRAVWIFAVWNFV
eukprot:1306336-Rhodomonas_salina.1